MGKCARTTAQQRKCNGFSTKICSRKLIGKYSTHKPVANMTSAMRQAMWPAAFMVAQKHKIVCTFSLGIFKREFVSNFANYCILLRNRMADVFGYLFFCFSSVFCLVPNPKIRNPIQFNFVCFIFSVRFCFGCALLSLTCIISIFVTFVIEWACTIHCVFDNVLASLIGVDEEKRSWTTNFDKTINWQTQSGAYWEWYTQMPEREPVEFYK